MMSLPTPTPNRPRYIRLGYVRLRYINLIEPLLAVALAVAACALPVYALESGKTLTQYSHRVWNQEEGLLEPTIYSILQSRDGYLWLGTQNGVIRFDGERFRPVRMTPGSNELEPALMRSLYEDNQGVIWAASIGNGLARIAGRSRRWFTTRDGLPSDIVGCVVPNKAGGLWLCTTQGLVAFHDRPTKVYTTADGLPNDHIHSACEATDGTLWVTTMDGGVSLRSGERFRPLPGATPELTRDVHALYCSHDGSVWAGNSEGLFRFHGTKLEHYTAQNGLPDNAVSTIVGEADGSIWVGTQTGIARFHDGDWSTFTTKDGLSHSTVFAMLLDREGSLWVGTKNGLDQFTDSRVTPYTTSEGMPSNDTGPVLEDTNHTLWVGTRDDGLARFDGHRFTRVNKAEGLADDRVLSLAHDAAGDVWAGTERGLSRLHDGRVAQNYTIANGLPANAIRSLFLDATGALWAGTDLGVALFDGVRFVQPPEFRPLNSHQILALGGGRTTRLFISTTAGQLYTLKADKVAAHPQTEPSRPIASYYADTERHSLWMGTLGSGLLRWRDGALLHVRVKDGLFDDQIYAILPDDHQNIWFASSKGIFRISKDDLEEFGDGKRKSVVSVPFTTGQLRFECQAGVQPAAYKTSDGRLWFSTTNGLVVVDPNHLLQNPLPPPTQIEAVFVNGQRRDAKDSLTLAAYEKNLEIRYAGLSFVMPEKSTFRYILEGYDKEWVEAGGRREAFYTNLPPGHFRFRVIACSSDGVWSSHGAAVAFTIEPRLYQRHWFFPLLAALLGLAIWLGYQLRIRNLQRGFDLVLAERSRIARELHDTLLQGLSGVTMQLQALWTRLPASAEKHVLQEIIRDAGTCLADARQSLWGLRSSAGSENSLAENLERHARQALTGSSIRLVLEVDRSPFKVSPEVEYELIRIAQEAITNAIRHAEPNVIEVRLQHRANQALEMTIRDDGKGFDTDVQRAQFGHYGLIGMRERAEEIGAKLIVSSMAGFGTDVAVIVPLVKGASDSEYWNTGETRGEKQRI